MAADKNRESQYGSASWVSNFSWNIFWPVLPKIATSQGFLRHSGKVRIPCWNHQTWGGFVERPKKRFSTISLEFMIGFGSLWSEKEKVETAECEWTLKAGRGRKGWGWGDAMGGFFHLSCRRRKRFHNGYFLQLVAESSWSWFKVGSTSPRMSNGDNFVEHFGNKKSYYTFKM